MPQLFSAQVCSLPPAIAFTEQQAVAPAQTTVPALQVNPHEVPSHVAVALMGGTQGVHELPQLWTLVLGSHALPHA
jgi:hypothetical protein